MAASYRRSLPRSCWSVDAVSIRSAAHPTRRIIREDQSRKKTHSAPSSRRQCRGSPSRSTRYPRAPRPRPPSSAAAHLPPSFRDSIHRVTRYAGERRWACGAGSPRRSRCPTRRRPMGPGSRACPACARSPSRSCACCAGPDTSEWVARAHGLGRRRKDAPVANRGARWGEAGMWRRRASACRSWARASPPRAAEERQAGSASFRLVPECCELPARGARCESRREMRFGVTACEKLARRGEGPRRTSETGAWTEEGKDGRTRTRRGDSEAARGRGRGPICRRHA